MPDQRRRPYGVFRQIATIVEVEAILFADAGRTALAVPGAIARRRRDDDIVFTYIEVRADVRRRGFGSLVLQAAKEDCHARGPVPAARTGVSNLGRSAR